MAEQLPSGYAKRGSGVIVKKSLALATTQDPQFGWMPVGLEDSEQRGVDRARTPKYVEKLKEIETSRRRDPIVFRTVDYYDKLAVGIGFTLESENKDVLRAAQAFWDLNDLDFAQHQMAIELATTGDLFMWMPSDDGSEENTVPALILIPSSQIDRIATKDGKPWYYRRKWTDYEYNEPKEGVVDGRFGIGERPRLRQQDIPADEMVHIAVNRSAGELRGTSMLESTIYWSSLYGRTLETIWALAVAKSFIAWHIKVDEPNDDQLKDLITKIETDAVVTKTDPRGRAYRTMSTGQIMTTGTNVSVEQLNSQVRGGSLNEELRRILLMAAVGPGLPEYVLSDGNNANRATTTSQSDPLFRVMQGFQWALKQGLKRVYRKVFDRFMSGGSFKNLPPPEDGNNVSDWLNVKGVDIIDQDTMKDVPPALQAVTAEVWSKEEFNRRVGTDWEQIKTEIEDERESGHGVTPEPGMSQFQFPFAPSTLAAAKIDPERHSEILTVMTKHRNRAKTAVDTYKTALLEHTGNRHEMLKAMGAFLTEIQSVRKDLMATARSVGNASMVVEDAE